jgi:hypothetical protein
VTVPGAQNLATDSVKAALPVEHHCRNCGAVANRHYCPECGQETRAALPTLREFMREAMGRLVAFDGRLWRTLYALLLRPGFLTRAYLAGRRRHYIRPARLLLVTSLLLFAVIRFEVRPVDLSEAVTVDSSDSPTAATTGKSRAAEKSGGSVKKDALRDTIENLSDVESSHAAQLELTPSFSIGIDKDANVIVRGAANSLLTAELRKRFDRFNRQPQSEKAEQILTGVLRYGSYAMFLLLPAFAWLQQVSYVGRGRRYPGRPRLYAEHLVYAAHLHTFWFLVTAIALAVPIPAVRWVLALWAIYYFARAKRVVYGGRWYGRLVRSFFVFVAYSIVIVVAIVGLVFASVLLR